jgi:hypothetical protein
VIVVVVVCFDMVEDEDERTFHDFGLERQHNNGTHEHEHEHERLGVLNLDERRFGIIHDSRYLAS